MTATFGAAATATNSVAQTFSHTLPTGITAGMLLLLVEAWTTNGNVPPTTDPTGWTRAGNAVGGAGSWASGTGPRGLTVWWKIAAGTESGTTVSVPNNGGPTTDAGRSARVESSRWSTDATWRPPLLVAGADTAADTTWSVAAAGNASPPASAGHQVYTASVIATTGSPALTSPSLTWAGAVLGTLAAAATGTATGGYGARLILHRAAVTSGASTAAPAFAATTSA